MKTSRLLCASILGLLLTSAGMACAEDALWSDNVAETLKKAEDQKKDVLMDFTGSNWCGWCMKLKKEVFDTDAFKKAAPEHFLMIELDFPNPNKLPKNTQEQNNAWMKKFEIQGFPTIMVADAKGRPVGQLGYQEGGPDAWLKSAEEIRAHRVARDEKWAAAEKATGGAKAKLIVEGLDALGNPELTFKFYDAEIAQAIALDADGSAGVKAQYEAKRNELKEAKEKAAATQAKQEAIGAKIQPLMATVKENPEGAVKALEELAAKADSDADVKQMALFVACQVTKSVIKDEARAEKYFDASIAAAPESDMGKQLVTYKDRMFPKKAETPTPTVK